MELILPQVVCKRKSSNSKGVERFKSTIIVIHFGDPSIKLTIRKDLTKDMGLPTLMGAPGRRMDGFL